MDKWILKIKKEFFELEFVFDCWDDFADFLSLAAESAKGDYEFIVQRGKEEKNETL